MNATDTDLHLLSDRDLEQKLEDSFSGRLPGEQDALRRAVFQELANRRVTRGLHNHQEPALSIHETAALLQSEIMRYDLSKRQIVVASALVKASLELGNRTVKIPRLEVLSDLTGFTYSVVYKTIRELIALRVLKPPRKTDNATEYEINADTETWRCPPRQTLSKIQHGLDWVKIYNSDSPAAASAVLPIELDYGPPPDINNAPSN